MAAKIPWLQHSSCSAHRGGALASPQYPRQADPKRFQRLLVAGTPIRIFGPVVIVSEIAGAVRPVHRNERTDSRTKSHSLCDPGGWLHDLSLRAGIRVDVRTCDPKTLTRAARDHLVKQPGFAMQAALAALHWMSMGHGYELIGLDVLEAHRLAIDAARTTQQVDKAQATVEQVLAPDRPMSAWMRRSLGIPPATPIPQRH